ELSRLDALKEVCEARGIHRGGTCSPWRSSRRPPTSKERTSVVCFRHARRRRASPWPRARRGVRLGFLGGAVARRRGDVEPVAGRERSVRISRSCAGLRLLPGFLSRLVVRLLRRRRAPS